MFAYALLYYDFGPQLLDTYTALHVQQRVFFGEFIQDHAYVW